MSKKAKLDLEAWRNLAQSRANSDAAYKEHFRKIDGIMRELIIQKYGPKRPSGTKARRAYDRMHIHRRYHDIVGLAIEVNRMGVDTDILNSMAVLLR